MTSAIAVAVPTLWLRSQADDPSTTKVLFPFSRAPSPAEPGQPVARKPALRARLRQAWEVIKGEHASAARLGVSVGVGVFAGCSPFHGFQFLLALALAFLLRLNKLSVLLGLQISAPPFTVVVIYAGLQLGEWMTHGDVLPLRLDAVRELMTDELPRRLLIDFVAGSLTLGVALGLLSGALTTFLVRRSRRRTLRTAADPA